MKPIIHLVSVSGGKDSTATLLLARELHGEDVIGAFADTGNEHELTYEYIDYLRQATGVPIVTLKRDFSQEWQARMDYIKNHWPAKGVPGEVIDRVLSFMASGPTGVPMLDACVIKGRFPSRGAQFCTHMLKVEPLTEYALDLLGTQAEQVWSWQGVRMEESLWRQRKHHISGHMVRSHAEVGGGLFNHLPILRWTAQDVFDAHRACGIKPNPLYTLGCDRVGCMPCINTTKDAVLNMASRWPQHIERIAQWEEIVCQASKHRAATFFPALGDTDSAFERGNIRQVVAWAQTGYGGKQYDLFRVHQPLAACASSYGLCDGAT